MRTAPRGGVSRAREVRSAAQVNALPAAPSYLRVCLSRAILALGVSMAFLDVPAEWLSLACEWTWMLLLEDVQQGVFYSTLFCFWIIFCGEHLMVSTAPCSVLFLFFFFSRTSRRDVHFLTTPNSLGAQPEEPDLGVLVASWAGGVRLVRSPHI